MNIPPQTYALTLADLHGGRVVLGGENPDQESTLGLGPRAYGTENVEPAEDFFFIQSFVSSFLGTGVACGHRLWRLED